MWGEIETNIRNEHLGGGGVPSSQPDGIGGGDQSGGQPDQPGVGPDQGRGLGGWDLMGVEDRWWQGPDGGEAGVGPDGRKGQRGRGWGPYLVTILYLYPIPDRGSPTLTYHQSGILHSLIFFMIKVQNWWIFFFIKEDFLAVKDYF